MNTSSMYEFCPRCDARLALQKGFRNDLSYWICKGCGEMLINPDCEDAQDDIVWICDGCGKMLNSQLGFHTGSDKWICTECGFANDVRSSEVYLSEYEYRSSLQNPYKGMSDADVLALSEYQEICFLGGTEHVTLVSKAGDELPLVRKNLSVYDAQVYEYLLHHPIPNVPGMKAVYHGDNHLVVLEEFIEGSSLGRLLEDGPLEFTEAVGIACQTARILQKLHTASRPIIHRDIKPSNIMICPDGEVYLLDVNAAKYYDPEEREDTRLLGTPYFAAPEQFGYGFLASSEKTDCYALGVLLNVMLTGSLPKEKAADGPAWEVIRRCMQLNPEDRYSDDELIEALDMLASVDAGKES